MKFHFILFFWLFKLSSELYEFLPDSFKLSDEIWDSDPSNDYEKNVHLIQAVRAHNSEYIDQRNGVVYKSGTGLINGNECREPDPKELELIHKESNTWRLFDWICFGDKTVTTYFDFTLYGPPWYQFKFKFINKYEQWLTVKIVLDSREYGKEHTLCTFQMYK